MDNYYKGLLIVANIPCLFVLIGALTKSIVTGHPGYFILAIVGVAVLVGFELAVIFRIF